MAGVEIPAAWLLVVDSFAHNPFSRVGWMAWLWKGRGGASPGADFDIAKTRRSEARVRNADGRS